MQIICNNIVEDITMLKKIFLVIFMVITIIFISNCASRTSVTKKTNKIKVVVSFNALKEFAFAVGGDKIDIVTMVPDGTEPHDFEPKARDLEELSSANVFIYNGAGMESWAQKTLDVVDNKTLISVDTSIGCKLIENKDKEAKNENGSYDPHVWMSPSMAKIQVKNIKNALIKADPRNRIYYEKNYDDFIKKIDSVINEYSVKLKPFKGKNIVTGHAAFAYLCRDFDLNQNSIEDVFAEGEPSARRMLELAKYCKANGIKTIFVENMVSPKVSETLAGEVGASSKAIYTMESNEDSKNYIERIRYNLEAIYESFN